MNGSALAITHHQGSQGCADHSCPCLTEEPCQPLQVPSPSQAAAGPSAGPQAPRRSSPTSPEDMQQQPRPATPAEPDAAAAATQGFVMVEDEFPALTGAVARGRNPSPGAWRGGSQRSSTSPQ